MRLKLPSPFLAFHGPYLLFLSVFIIVAGFGIISVAIYVLVKLIHLIPLKSVLRENFEENTDSATLALKNLNGQSEHQRRHILSLLTFDPKEMGMNDKDSFKHYFVGDFKAQDADGFARMRDEMLARTSQKIKEQDNFILFYDRPQFQGNLFLIPCDLPFHEKKEKDEKNNADKEIISGVGFLTVYPFALHHRFSCYIPSETRMILKGRLPSHLTKVEAPDLILTEGYHKFLHIPFAHISEIKVEKTKPLS